MRCLALARIEFTNRRRAAGGTLIGIFVGLILGIVIAATVGLYVTGGWKAYRQQTVANNNPRDRDPAKKADNDKPRFDFYKILPGGEEPKVTTPKPPDRGVADRAAERSLGKNVESTVAPQKAPESTPLPASGKTGDRFWLQAGSFASEADAENLKARLALAGWEAQLQQGTLPDKAVRYRVRLGPYDNTDELNRTKNELARRGFDVAVIRY
ncbi:MAG TPA: SPOR domain-containing protein [Casimicrobiaceae bacterium]|nr:SPOR domain-containing protein [Casimicrobiaceae bacterium]